MKSKIILGFVVLVLVVVFFPKDSGGPLCGPVCPPTGLHSYERTCIGMPVTHNVIDSFSTKCFGLVVGEKMCFGKEHGTDPNSATVELDCNYEPFSGDISSENYVADYNGEAIEGVEVSLSWRDYTEINSQFWASPYFPYENKIYYSVSEAISRELVGVDADSFEVLFREDRDGVTQYAKDKNSVICDDRRAAHMDLDSFEVLHHDVGVNYYVRDKDSIYVGCKEFLIADASTFEIITYDGRQVDGIYTRTFYAKDANNIYVDNKIFNITGTLEGLVLLDKLYAHDGTNVYWRGDRVGKAIATIPSDFNGVLTVIRPHKDYAYEDYKRRDILPSIERNFVLAQHKNGDEDIILGMRPRKFVAHNNVLYYINDVGMIQSIKIGETEPKNIPLPVAPVKPTELPRINHFYVSGDKIFYLAGENCNGYLEGCDLSLNEFDISKEKNQILGEHSTSRRILGYDATEDKLYLAYGDGDGGCSFGSYEEYSFLDKNLSKVGSFSSCEGGDLDLDPGVEELRSRLQFVEENIFADSVRVEKRTISSMEQ